MMIFSPFPLLNPAALILHIVRNAQENSQEGLQTHQDILKSEEKKKVGPALKRLLYSLLSRSHSSFEYLSHLVCKIKF